MSADRLDGPPEAGKPQRRVSVATDVFSACSEHLFNATGAFRQAVEEFVLCPLKRDPTVLHYQGLRVIMRIAAK